MRKRKPHCCSRGANDSIYDPKLGRFLQADPFVQAPKNGQNLNRYSYVLNNPLSYTDPSGYFLDKLWDAIKPFIGIIVAAVIVVATGGWGGWVAQAWYNAAIVGAASGATSAAVNGGNILRGALLGGLAGAAGYGIGKLGLEGAEAFIANGALGGSVAELGGGNFGHGFLSAGVGNMVGSHYGADPSWEGFFATLISAGTVSEVTGGKFGNGATGAAIGYAIGKLANETEEQRLEREGRPLTTDEREVFAEHFPEEILDSARIVDGRVPWWLPNDMAAVTLGNRIYFREGFYVPGTARGVELLGHELVHVQQFAEGMTILEYIWESRRGYLNNPFEVEAYRMDREIRRGFCMDNPDAVGC